MTRQLKFRGIATVNDKHNGVKVGDFVYGCFVETNVDCQILFGDGEQISVDRPTVGQFTGLLDKVGVGIYEGDVIRCDEGFLWLVEWCDVNCGFLAYGEDVSTINKLGLVIGNIHQNPELIS